MLVKMCSNSNSLPLLVGMHNGIQPLWKIVFQFLIKLNILLPYDPTIIPLGIYSSYVHTKTCMQIFIAALFSITKVWKQPKSQLIGGIFTKYGYQYNRIFSNKMEWTTGNLQREWTLMALWNLKEARLKKLIPLIWIPFTLSDSIYVTVWER